jgi:hypothetical protein
MKGITMILEHQTLHVTNLLSVRRQVLQTEIPPLIEKLVQYMTANGAQKTGYLISSTFAVDQATKRMDSGFYLPIDREIPSTAEFIFKPHLYLINCLLLKYKGHPQGLQPAMEQLNSFVLERKLTPISTVFSANQNEIKRQEDFDQFEVHVYVSISPNIF